MESVPLLWDDTAAGDEATLLREALVFIGDLQGDDHDDGLFSSLFAEPLPVTSTYSLDLSGPTSKDRSIVAPTATPLALMPASGSRNSKPKGKRSSTKRREELLHIRERARELEYQLTRLKGKANKAHRDNTINRSHSPSPELLLGACKQIATRQYEQRQRSEMENIKLKRLLEDQIQISKSLKRMLLHKRPKFEAMTAPLYVSERGGSPPMGADHHVFDALLASMENQYAETSRVLANVDPTTIGRAIELVRDEYLGTVIRTTESRLLPFAYDVAVQAFWATSPAILKNRMSGVLDLDISDDVIKAQLSVHATFGRNSGDLTVYLVDQRHQEAEHAVFLSAGLFHPTAIGDTNMDGVSMRHRGWSLLEPVDASATTKAVTKMTSYLLAVPEVVDDRQDHTHQVEALTAFMMSAVSSELEARNEAFENCLFDLSL